MNITAKEARLISQSANRANSGFPEEIDSLDLLCQIIRAQASIGKMYMIFDTNVCGKLSDADISAIVGAGFWIADKTENSYTIKW